MIVALRLVVVLFESYFLLFAFTLAAHASHFPGVLSSLFVYGVTASALFARYLDLVRSQPSIFALSAQPLDPQAYNPRRRLLFYIAFQLTGFFFICLYQHLSGTWFLNLSNFGVASLSDHLDANTGRLSLSSLLLSIDWGQTCSFLVAGPLFEELLFRGIVLRLALNDDQTPLTGASIITGLAFGLFHLPNTLSTLVHPVYAIFQICIATLVGTAYAMHTLLAGRALWHTFLLHVLNNLFAMFLPLDLPPTEWPSYLCVHVVVNALAVCAVVKQAHSIFKAQPVPSPLKEY